MSSLLQSRTDKDSAATPVRRRAARRFNPATVRGAGSCGHRRRPRSVGAMCGGGRQLSRDHVRRNPLPEPTRPDERRRAEGVPKTLTRIIDRGKTGAPVLRGGDGDGPRTVV